MSATTMFICDGTYALSQVSEWVQSDRHKHKEEGTDTPEDGKILDGSYIVFAANSHEIRHLKSEL
jgi:hypothetical protein